MFIEICNVNKIYTSKNKDIAVALENFNLFIEKGEFICLIGPSGCGKTTLLNLIAGFDKPTSGVIMINNEEVEGPSLDRVTIFQNYGLLPWRNVLKNVELGLESKGFGKKERIGIAKKYIDLVGLTKFIKFHPAELSGGMQQRVSIARALAVDPEIIFMDEPFGALDALTRMDMQDEIESIWEEKKTTIIFVTHDIDECVFLADRIVIMTPFPGRIKNIIDVPLPRKRDRTSIEFVKIRDYLYNELERKTQKKNISV